MNDLTVTEPIAADAIRSRILTIRGVQVMLDRDLAELYGVPTKRLNEQVKRNAERFPVDFMFHLAKTEMAELVANCDRFKKMKHSSVPMTAFSEHGIIMLAGVLKSRVAIEASDQIPRPLPHHRQINPHTCRCIPQPPRQEVSRLLILRQIQHS